MGKPTPRPASYAADSPEAVERATTLPVAEQYRFVSSDPLTNRVSLMDPLGVVVEFVPVLLVREVIHIVDEHHHGGDEECLDRVSDALLSITGQR